MRVVRRLEQRGFPSLEGWLFFTLTIDANDLCEEDTLEMGKDRLRRVFYALRKQGYEIRRYFSKLELHASGFPHWHVGVQTSRYVSSEIVTRLWGLGFAKVKRVKGNSWRYLLKYVVKGTGALPPWVLDYPKRIRVFQTSVGFYDSPAPAGTRRAAPVGGRKNRTLREKFGDWEASALVKPAGAGLHRQRVRLIHGFRRFFCELASTPGRFVDGYTIGTTYEELLNHVTKHRERGDDPCCQDSAVDGSHVWNIAEIGPTVCTISHHPPCRGRHI